MFFLKDIDIGRRSRAEDSEAVEEVFFEEKLWHEEEQKSRQKVILNVSDWTICRI